MKIIFYIHLILFFVCCQSKTYAQNPSLKFIPIADNLGRTENSINDILQDHKGFIWLATWSGLKKYDGHNTVNYRQELGNTHGLKSDKITCLFEDTSDRLWIGTNYTGLYQYDRYLDRFIQYSFDENDMNSLSNNNVWAITEDDEGLIWIGTENGLNCFSPKSKKFIHYKNSENDVRSLSHNFITSLCKTEEGELWVGTEEGLNRYISAENGELGYFVRYPLEPNDSEEYHILQHNFISCISPSSSEDKTIWVGTSIGLKKIRYDTSDLAQLEVRSFYSENDATITLSHRFVTDIIEDIRKNHLWIATYGGLNKFDITKNKIEHFYKSEKSQNSLTNNDLRSLFIDRAQNLWIGTVKGGNVLGLDAKPFQSFEIKSEEQSNNIVTCIINAKSSEGLWIGTKGAGLYFLPTKGGIPVLDKITHHPFKSDLAERLSLFITDLEIDRNGFLWMTTEGAGIIKTKESEISKSKEILYSEQFTNEDFLKDDYVMTIDESDSGNLWFGYWDKGIGMYDANLDKFTHFSLSSDQLVNLQAYPIVHIAEVIEKGKPYLWIGTRGGGVLKMFYVENNKGLRLEKHYHYSEGQENGLSNNSINDFLFVDSSNSENSRKLWIGTVNGINILDTKTNNIEYIFEEDGLSNGAIQSIEQDNHGNIWVSTKNGFSNIKMAEGELNIQNFDSYDGLSNNFFLDESSTKVPSGNMFFGGVNGINYFDPLSIVKNTTPPQVTITGLNLKHEKVPIGKIADGRIILENNISETKEINLSYKDNVIGFEFVGLGFSKPQKIKYAYKLEGFNEDWVHVDATTSREAQYTNLPSKSFTFMVKAANSDGFWSDPAQIELNISPIFWKTKTAVIIYVLLLISLFYGILRLMKIRAEYAHNLHVERVEREKLEEVNKIKLQFFTNISHELRTPLTLIISPLEQYIKSKNFDKKVHKSMVRMHRNAYRLMTMIDQLLDIRKSEAGLMKLKASEGDFVKFSNEVILSFRGLAKQKKIKLKFRPEKKSIHIWYDRSQIEKVWYNLLSNAIKFTPEEGKIDVSLTVEGDAVSTDVENKFLVMRVKDSGIGIPDNQIQHVFDRFYQVEQDSDTAQNKGTGIGLALTKAIVERHNGSISVHNLEDQEGTLFEVRLPMGKEQLAPEDVKVSTDIKKPISKIGNLNPLETEELTLSKLDQEVLKNTDKSTLLIVEDNEDIRSYLAESFDKEYVVLQAVDGEDGLTKATANLPDLILADISMPNLNGLEMCNKLKSTIETSHIPIILLTARTSLIFKIDGVEKGADDYVTKPFNMQLLNAKIKNLISSRNKLKKKFAKNYNLSPKGIVMNTLDEQFLSNLKAIIEKNIDNSDFTVDLLAKALNMSRMQLYRKLKALAGKSPNVVIREIRLQRAAQLLQSKQYNIADVTYMVGYNDLKYFRDQFKKMYGMNPSQYVG